MSKKNFTISIVVFSVFTLASISFVVAQNNLTIQKEGLTQTTFQVSNLSCGSCLATIAEQLDKNEKMAGMTADLSLGLVTVSHQPEWGSQAIAQAITDAGYPARALTNTELNAVRAQGPENGTRYGCGSRGCGSGGCGLPAPTAKNVQTNPPRS